MIPLDVWRDRIVIRRGDGVSADEASQTLNWFFGHLDNSDGVRRQKIFQWVTGRARLPPNGFEVSQWTWVNMLGWPATKFTLGQLRNLTATLYLVHCTLYSSYCKGLPGFWRMTISVDRNIPPDHLPVAHTCFPTLDMPLYDSEEQLAQKLGQAIKHQNFHVA